MSSSHLAGSPMLWCGEAAGDSYGEQPSMETGVMRPSLERHVLPRDTCL